MKASGKTASWDPSLSFASLTSRSSLSIVSSTLNAAVAAWTTEALILTIVRAQRRRGRTEEMDVRAHLAGGPRGTVVLRSAPARSEIQFRYHLGISNAT